MAGTITVQNIQGPSTGANANKILIPSGQTLYAPGHVLQVVQSTTSTRVTTNSTANVDTTLEASITPISTSSKVLVTVSQHGLDKRTDNAYLELVLYANGSSIYQPNGQFMYNNSTSVQATGSAVFSYLHSPATTSSVTYKTMFNSPPARNVVAVQWSQAESTIVLMEIAQ